MQSIKNQKYTYADYLKWEDGNRYELIDGEVYMMTPAPSPVHQRIIVSLTSQLYNYLKGKSCEVFVAPFDVRLSTDIQDDTVVQPDITIVCDPAKIDDQGCKGAPDMVVEVLSPSSMGYDQIEKFNKYREAGVREYWIVNPEGRSVQVFLLKGGQYVSYAYGDTAIVTVSVLNACQINLADVFPPPPPKEARSTGPA